MMGFPAISCLKIGQIWQCFDQGCIVRLFALVPATHHDPTLMKGEVLKVNPSGGRAALTTWYYVLTPSAFSGGFVYPLYSLNIPHAHMLRTLLYEPANPE